MFGNYTTAKPELSENLLRTRTRSSHLFILFQQNVQPSHPSSQFLPPPPPGAHMQQRQSWKVIFTLWFRCGEIVRRICKTLGRTFGRCAPKALCWRRESVEDGGDFDLTCTSVCVFVLVFWGLSWINLWKVSKVMAEESWMVWCFAGDNLSVLFWNF